MMLANSLLPQLPTRSELPSEFVGPRNENTTRTERSTLLPELDARSRAKVDETVEGFEALFLGMLLEPMEKAGESFFGSGSEGRTFGNMFRTQLADQLSKARPLGIADQIEPSILRQQALEQYRKGL